MAPLFNLLRDIGPSRTQWAVKLRLIRCYHTPAFGNRMRIQSTECVFHDFEGVKIHATIKTDIMNRLNTPLTEGSLYVVKNFVVTSNKMRYKTTNNRYMLIFINRSRVTQIFDDGFPMQMFDFKPFSEVCNVEQVNENEMIDIIGRVVRTNEIQRRIRDEQETRWMEVVLEDPDRNQLTCTLWGEYIDQMVEHVRPGGATPIMILLFCRAKLYQNRVSISTTYNASKLILDGDFAEVVEFKSRFVDEPLEDPTLGTRSLSSMSIGGSDISIGNCLVRTIEHIRHLGEVGTFWVSGTIVGFDTTEDWWYLSCPKCFKKISQVHDRFYCTNCDRFDASGTPRYKIRVLVQDNFDNATFILWDQQSFELIGKTALELREQSVEVGEGILPEEINNLLDNELFFKVQVTPEQLYDYHGPYSVKKIDKDMSKFPAHLIPRQDSGQTSQVQASAMASEKVGSTELGLITPKGSVTNQASGKEKIEADSVKRKLFDDLSANVPNKKRLIIKEEKD